MEGNFQIPRVVFEVSNIVVVYTQTNVLVYKNIVVICCPLLWCRCHNYAPEQDATSGEWYDSRMLLSYLSEPLLNVIHMSQLSEPLLSMILLQYLKEKLQAYHKRL
jgi:hypothetical protein